MPTKGSKEQKKHKEHAPPVIPVHQILVLSDLEKNIPKRDYYL